MGAWSFLDMLAPRRCAGCEVPGAALCRACHRALMALPQPLSPQYSSAFPFAEPVRAVLHRGKFRDARSALALLADLAADRLHAPSGALVVPVPLGARRQRARGYNQASLVASVLAAHHDLTMAPLLTRVRETGPQTELGGRQRHDNLAGAFAAAEGIAGNTVWLIDDVRTTGATTEAARAALLAAGANSVQVAVLATVL